MAPARRHGAMARRRLHGSTGARAGAQPLPLRVLSRGARGETQALQLQVRNIGEAMKGMNGHGVYMGNIWKYYSSSGIYDD